MLGRHSPSLIKTMSSRVPVNDERVDSREKPQNLCRKLMVVSGLMLLGLVVAVVLLATNWRQVKESYVLRRAFLSAGKNAQGLTEYSHRQTGIVFVRLPGGAFLMGTKEEEIPRVLERYGENAVGYPEGPVHEVRVSPFLISKYEVTQDQWERVIGSNPSDFPGARRPVELVSWDACQEFCKRTGLSLPTEAEWEYACRAGTSGDFATNGALEEVGWYRQNSVNETHDVGQKRPNAFGLYDFHGNVKEWCEDHVVRDFYVRSPKQDPVCQEESYAMAVRGGGWWSRPSSCRSAFRTGHMPPFESADTGFRVVWRFQ